MRTGSLRSLTLAVLTAGAAALTAAGCSAGSGGPGGASGPTYSEAVDAMYPDVLSAMKAAMPQIQPEEYSDAPTDCGGPDVLDSKDASKRRASVYVRLPGDPSDTRTSTELVDKVVADLSGHGWQVQESKDTTPTSDPAGSLKYMTKPGVPGKVRISSAPFTLASGKVIQDLTANVLTDCLRNPDWRKP